jgi:hypothetical protein
MTIIRKQMGNLNKRSNSRVFKSNSFALAIDQRSGFKTLQKDMVFEPGTNYFVHKQESDKGFSLVNHPQNYPPIKKVERIALKYPSPEYSVSIGVIISADQLGLPSHSSTFYSSTVWPSLGIGVSGDFILDFSNVNNSMYYYVVFQGV